MTGFGSGEHDAEHWHCFAEIRSLNQRFLDIRIRIPARFEYMIPALKKEISKVCSRGKVELSVKLEQSGARLRQYELNHEVAQSYAGLITAFEDLTQRSVSLNLQDLIGIPKLLQESTPEIPDEEGESLILSALKQALEEFAAMKHREGESLLSEIQERLGQCALFLKDIEEHSGEASASHQQRLLDNLEKLGIESERMDERICKEIALYADRLDIREEIVRFHTHLSHMQEILKTPSIGKKAEFLLQEILREANTIASKSNHTLISHAVVNIKSELEKLREQLQNLE